MGQQNIYFQYEKTYDENKENKLKHKSDDVLWRDQDGILCFISLYEIIILMLKSIFSCQGN